MICLLLILPLLLPFVLATKKVPIPKQFTKHYHVYDLPHAQWDDGDKNTYKHEIVLQGGLDLPIRRGSNYSVYPTRSCGNKRISFVVQLDAPKEVEDSVKKEQQTCTVSITIDDGHVEVWYGLCATKQKHWKRKFNFPLNPMSVVYFTFHDLTMTVYKRDSDFGQDFEMGRIEHVAVEPQKFTEWPELKAFTYMDSCKNVDLKMVFHEDDWRNLPEEEGKNNERPTATDLQWRIITIFVSVQSVTALCLSTMYVWSQGVPFCTNWIYDSLIAKNTKDGKVHHAQEEEGKSCETAEDRTGEEEEQMREDLFGDKGTNKPPWRAPPGYALEDYEAPYKDDVEVELDDVHTAME